MARRSRIAGVYLPGAERGAGTGKKEDRRLAVALLDASPRIAGVGPGSWRLDARGWDRRGGEEALADRIGRVVRTAGFSKARVGLADGGMSAGVAARLAVTVPLIVPPGESRTFLAPLPLALLPLTGELRETLEATGIRRIGELAARSPEELEARFGPPGIRAHRLARGEDDDPLPWQTAEELPEASLELDGPVEELEPLLFILRRLLARMLADLRTEARAVARLEVVLGLEDGSRRKTSVTPARPSLREGLLFELCRAVLEREVERLRLPSPVRSLALRVSRRAPPEVRQTDLFAREPRDPLAADAVLARLRARLGEDAVAEPAPRADHRPEVRNRWEAVSRSSRPPRSSPPIRPARPGRARPPSAALLPSAALRILSPPRRVEVRTAGGRPSTVRDGAARHGVVAAEGPERLSGGWWRRSYRREYYRLLTDRGELLWIFRETPPRGAVRWWLHGWWD